MPPKKRRLLLAEDHEDTRELLTFVLTQENYEVATSTSVTRALELAKRQKFDVMIIDSLLDDGSGLDLCRAIRQYDNLTPIMFYSALAYEKDRQDALKAGAQDYLVKPVDIALLVEKLGKLFAVPKRTRAQVRRAPGARKDSGDLKPAFGV
jgi:DNA-binding response OmpR family regulator